jgi:hypothetical protein
VAVTIDVAAVPRPDGAPLARWLQTFPSYGYVLSVAPANVAAVIGRFAARGIATAEIGEIAAGRCVAITDGHATETVWDFAREPLIGCGRRQTETTQALA